MRAIPTEPCLGLIHTFEGRNGQFEAQATQDPSGNWEIGWSHKLPGPTDEVWDLQHADHQALVDLGVAAQGVCDALGATVNGLTAGQYAALIDFTYNEGVEAFTGSTLCQLVLSGALHLVPAEFGKWVYETVDGVKKVEPGLVRRRKADTTVWLK